MAVNKVVLVRLDSGDQGTFGRLYVDDNEVFYTMELPWRDNRSNVSCIPKGTYRASYTPSRRFKRHTYELTNTGKRQGIRIHAATYAGDTSKGFRNHLAGCLALGERLGVMDGQKCLLVSKPAIRRFEQILNGKDFTLEIR